MEKGIAAFRNYKHSSWKNGTKEISTDFITKHIKRRPAIVKPDEVFDYYEIDVQEDAAP